MNTVTFPGLGLTFELNRVAFCLGDFCIYWYGIIIGLGFILGGGFCYWRAKDFGLKSDDILDLLLFAAPGGIIGARIYYVIFSWDQYKNDLASIFNIRQGGLAIYGGVIAAVLTVFVYERSLDSIFSGFYRVATFDGEVDILAIDISFSISSRTE